MGGEVQAEEKEGERPRGRLYQEGLTSKRAPMERTCFQNIEGESRRVSRGHSSSSEGRPPGNGNHWKQQR